MSKTLGIYLRLSDEDSLNGESNSIINQRKLIYTYISNNDDFLEYEVIEFVDDGYSGTNFNRPAIKELLMKARNNEINCVAIKDFSRIGRNYIEVGNLIEQVFPFLNIRLISINDYYDSDNNKLNKNFLDVAFKNVLHDLYSKDLSTKIVSARRQKAKQGKYLSAYAPFGYKKDVNKQLVIDEDSAAVVRKIFKMTLTGMSRTKIAKTLNDDNTLTMLQTKLLNNSTLFCQTKNDKNVWKVKAISTILRDRRYTGDAVYGKVKPTNVGSSHQIYLPEEDWIIVKNSHEAIISQDTFEKAALTFRKYAKRTNVLEYPLKGKVVCGCCNCIMEKINKNPNTIYYKCTTSKTSSLYGCNLNKTFESNISSVILIYLNTLADLFIDKDNSNKLSFNNKIKENKTKLIENKIKELENNLTKLKSLKMKDYEAFKENKIEKDVYLSNKSNYDSKIEILIKNLELSQLEIANIKNENNDGLNIEKMIGQFKTFDKLTDEIVQSFVDKIVIDENGAVKVFWLFDLRF